MKAVARAASIAIPPAYYRKGDGELEEALEGLLEKHGLSASSDSGAIVRL